VSTLSQTTLAAAESGAAPGREWRPPSYWPFVVPALIVVLAVITHTLRRARQLFAPAD